MSTPTLRLGAKGEQVRALQTYLARFGFPSSDADTEWHDLTNESGGAPVAAGDPAAFTDPTGRSSVQHVFYRGTNGHICELAWSPMRWEWHDLKTDSGGEARDAAGDPAAYSDPTGQSSVQHVFYRGMDGRVLELSW